MKTLMKMMILSLLVTGSALTAGTAKAKPKKPVQPKPVAVKETQATILCEF